jgi:phage terminase large subunit-like protein
LFKQAASLIQRSGLTEELEVKAGYGEIRFKGDRARVGPRIRVIASDATTADGVIPTLALVDELHRHKDGDLYGVFRDGLGKRGGRMLTISTAGYDLNSALGKLRDMAHTLPTFERTGCYNHATAPSFEWHEWCLTDLDDRADMALVKKANPASFVTPEWLRRRFESPSTTPGQWARYACGLWTSGEDTWIEPMVWDALKADIGGVSPGDEVFLAIRVTQGGGCGIGIAAPRDEERIAVACEMLPYDFPGLEFRLRQLHDIYRIRNIYGYAPQFGIGVDVMRDAGLPMEDLAQSPMRLMEATSSFRTLVASHRLIHDGDPELRKQVLSGRVKEAPTGSYLMPTKEVQGLVAVILAADQASQWSPRPLVLLPAGVG